MTNRLFLTAILISSRCLMTQSVFADVKPPSTVHLPQSGQAPAQAASIIPKAPHPRLDPAFEFNVLWPFFPGGLTDFKFLLPTLARGQAILGLHSDFSWRARDKDAGKVAVLAAKLGYRQFILDGLHLDATVNVGWRQERDNPYDGTTLDAFIGRFWGFGGYQYDVSEQWYVNARGGIGIHLWRTDKFRAKERNFIPAGDINVGVRF